MPLLKAEAEKLSQDLLLQGVIEEMITEDQMFEILPFKGIVGKGYVYNREKTLSEPTFLDPNDEVTEGGATFEEVTAKIRPIIGDVDVDQFLANTMDDSNDQEAIQIAKKSKALARKLSRTIVSGSAYAGTWSTQPAGFITAIEVSDANGIGTGTLDIDVDPALKVKYTAPGSTAGAWTALAADGTFIVRSGDPARYIKITVDVSECGAADSTAILDITHSKEFTGLKYLVDPAKEILAGANGADLTFDMMDELIDAIKTGKPSAILMNERSIRKYKTLLRGAGGVDSAMLQLPNFGAPILTFSGVPILKNNNIPVDETLGTGSNLTRIYAAYFDEEEGVTGLYGGRNAGVKVERVGLVQNKDAMRIRVKQYAGLANHSTHALACLKGVK